MSMFRATPRPLIAAALAALLLVATATPAAANREHQQMLADIRMLQEQSSQLQLMLAGVTRALEAVTTRLDQQSESQRKTTADQRLLFDTLTTDLRVLREKIDDSNVRLSTLTQEVEAIRTTMPIGGGAPAMMPPNGQATDPAGAPGALPGDPGAAGALPPAVNPAAGMSPQRLYETAYADYASGQWNLAIAGFETFIRTFPRSELADRAQWYIGESHMLDGKFQQAVAAYDAVIANYPTGAQAPFAYYKKGVALLRLGQAERAREAWTEVMKRHPDSDASALARQGLDRLAKPSR
jgi:tol-pal system protein YbgF